jgi:hypothetical protein
MDINSDFTIVTKRQGNLEISDDVPILKNKIYIKEWVGINSENKTGTHGYTLYKYTDDNEKYKLHFMLYKIQKRHYININNTYISELDKFLMINNIVCLTSTVCINNAQMGEIVLEGCDLDLVNKCLSIIQAYQENNPKTFMDYIDFIFS